MYYTKIEKICKEINCRFLKSGPGALGEDIPHTPGSFKY